MTLAKNLERSAFLFPERPCGKDLEARIEKGGHGGVEREVLARDPCPCSALMHSS